MGNKYVGLGFTLKMNSTAIAGIRGISNSEASGTAVDITVMDDYTTSDRFMRKAGGLIDPGAVTLQLAYDPADATQHSLQQKWRAGSTQGFTIVFPTTTLTETFSGIVNGVGREIPFGELVTCSVRIDISGDPGFKSTT